MANSILHDQVIDQLPLILPLVIVDGLVLLPQANVPLPVTQLVYIDLIKQTFQEEGVIGLIQAYNHPSDTRVEHNSILYKSGSVVKIDKIEAIEDSGIVAMLTCVCRFEVIQETIVPLRPYRQAIVSYETYKHDMNNEHETNFDRKRLFKALKKYFKKHDISPDWQELTEIPNNRLIATLTIGCPFSPGEKQALLELKSMSDQSKLLTALIEMENIKTPNYNCDYDKEMIFH